MAFLRIVALASLAAVALGCSGVERRGPFRAQFIDAETGRPISGVVLLAVWYSVTPNLVSGGSEQYFDSREVISGADGRAEIPRLTGPILRAFYDVNISYFVPGGYVLDRTELTPPDGTPYRASTVIRLRRRLTRDERCERLGFAMPFPSVPNNTTEIPLYLDAIKRESAELRCGDL